MCTGLRKYPNWQMQLVSYILSYVHFEKYCVVSYCCFYLLIETGTTYDIPVVGINVSH